MSGPAHRRERIIGSWIRTVSPRGVLRCRFDADGSYSFAIAGDEGSASHERGTYRTITRPSEDGGSCVAALLLRSDAGVDSALVVAFGEGELWLDGQYWQRVEEQP